MRNAFDDPDDSIETNKTEKKSGLKIDNSKSMFQPKVDSQKAFDAKVKEVMNDKIDRNKKALELGQKFLSMLHDRTLPSNKSLIQKDLEKQICNDLFFLASAGQESP